MKAQSKKEKAAAAGANGENAEAKRQEVERMCKGITTSDSAVTENEIGGWHRGRTELFTASEDKDHISFHNDHFKHDIYDGPNENEKRDEETKRIESTDSETMPFIAAETAEVTGEEHPERSTMNDVAGNEETTNEAGGRHCGRLVLRTVSEGEVLSCYMSATT